MSSYSVRTLDSLAALADYAPRWNDLWQRADVAIPTLRAEFLAQWIEQFAARERVRVLVVEHGDTAVAALPLVGTRVKRVVRAGGMPSNGWTAAGELLMDPAHELAQLARPLALAVRELPWTFLLLQPVQYEAARWQALLAAVSAVGLTYQTKPTCTIGTVQFPASWEQFEASLNNKHRRNVHRNLRRLHKLGATEFEDFPAPSRAEVAALMQTGFEIEDRSWKGERGTSVLRTERLADYYVRQAVQMARQGWLRIHFLTYARRRIAFQYGWLAKGTYFSPKIAYDPLFASYSPGHLLTGHVLRVCCDSMPQPRYDFHGDTTAAVARWTNGQYRVGSVAIPLQPLVGGALLQAYRWYNASVATA